MRARLGRGLTVLLAALAGSWLAQAATWGGITPGKTTRQEVQALYGEPTRERVVIDAGHAAAEWTYRGDRAPSGVERMVVSFGLIGPVGFAPEVVRGVTLYPKPRVFTLNTITSGWGKPDAIGTEEQTGRPAFRYQAQGLLVVLDQTGQWAELIVFAPAKPGTRP